MTLEIYTLPVQPKVAESCSKGWLSWCHENSRAALPAAPATLAGYLEEASIEGENTFFPEIIAAVVSGAHRQAGHPDPVYSPEAARTLAALAGAKAQNGRGPQSPGPALHQRGHPRRPADPIRRGEERGAQRRPHHADDQGDEPADLGIAQGHLCRHQAQRQPRLADHKRLRRAPTGERPAGGDRRPPGRGRPQPEDVSPSSPTESPRD